MASKLKNMFEQGGAAEKDPPPRTPGRMGGGGKLKNMFEDNNSSNVSNTSSVAPSPGANKFGSSLKSNSSGTFGDRGGSSVGAGGGGASSWNSKKPAQSKKAAPKPAQANLILAHLQARKSHQKVNKLRQRVALELIQFEYRNYLSRTAGTRATIRKVREQKMIRYQQNLNNLIGAARQRGMEICLAEAKERYLLFKRINNSNVYLHQLVEENVRSHIVTDERAAFDELCANEAPKILIPGTLENDEFTSRMHINKYMMHNYNVLLVEFVAKARRFSQKHEATERVHVMTDQCKSRVEILQESVFEHWGVQLQLCEREESKHRALLEDVRLKYVCTLTQRRALTLRETLMWTGAGSELEQRAGWVLAELLELRQIWDSYIIETVTCVAAHLGEKEARGRLGYGGLVHQERNGRMDIVRAVVGLRLQILQGDDIDDVGTERGSRTAIQWAEGRARYALEARIAATAFHTLLPGQEEAVRRRITLQEFNVRQKMYFSPEVTNFLLNISEPLMRRNIFRTYCIETSDALIRFGQIKVQAHEEITRNFSWLKNQLVVQYTASLEYLQFIELKERHLIKGMRQRVSERLKVHENLAAQVARSNMYHEATAGSNSGLQSPYFTGSPGRGSSVPGSPYGAGKSPLAGYVGSPTSKGSPSKRTQQQQPTPSLPRSAGVGLVGLSATTAARSPHSADQEHSIRGMLFGGEGSSTSNPASPERVRQTEQLSPPGGTTPVPAPPFMSR